MLETTGGSEIPDRSGPFQLLEYHMIGEEGGY